MHHEIVVLEKHQPLPAGGFAFTPGTTYNLTTYEPTSSREELYARIRNATILFVLTAKVDAEILHPDITPHLRCITFGGTGTDSIDLDACRSRNIRVVNCPGTNVDAVSEHAISLYFAARRNIVLLDRITYTQSSEWKNKGSFNQYMRLPDGKPPITCGDEVMGIVGHGRLGKKIAALARALGMRVLIADRKTSPKTAHGRVPFDDVLRQSTVLVLSLPRTSDTLNLISTKELAKMHPYAVIVNVARGGIVDESAVVQALKEKRIAGYATDVFQVEPAGGPQDTPLLEEYTRGLNITRSPHLAWYSQRTIDNMADTLKKTVEGWVNGNEINVVV